MYEAEIVGQCLGTELLQQEISCNKASNVADNLACIQAVTNRHPCPAHYLLNQLVQAAERLAKRHPAIDLTLRWVPGHKGIEGNELADAEAKKAARGDSSPEELLPRWLRNVTLPRSLAKVRQVFNQRLREQAREEWKSSPRAENMDRIDPGMPSKAFSKMAERLPRKQASLLIQLRTGHVPLQQHLHRMRKADVPTCPQCGLTKETVYHFLMECAAYNEERAERERHAGPASRSIKDLLSRLALLPSLFRYIHDTQRFLPTYGPLTLDGKEKEKERGAGRNTGGRLAEDHRRGRQ